MKTFESFEFVLGRGCSSDREDGSTVTYMPTWRSDNGFILLFAGLPAPESVQGVPIFIEPVVSPEEVWLHRAFEKEDQLDCVIGWTDHRGGIVLPDDWGYKGRRYRVHFNKNVK